MVKKSLTGRNVHHFATDQSGFTLIELVFVAGLVALLSGIATFAFHEWSIKSNVEAQVNQMATDFNELRVKAITSKQRHSITLNASDYVFKSYTSDDESKFAGTIISGGTHSVAFGLKKVSGASYGGEVYEIDQRGMVVGSTATIFLDVSRSANFDCLTLHLIRTNIGKKNLSGDKCDDK